MQNAYGKKINALESCYIINNSCNVRLIHVKNARKAQVIVFRLSLCSWMNCCFHWR